MVEATNFTLQFDFWHRILNISCLFNMSEVIVPLNPQTCGVFPPFHENITDFQCVVVLEY